MPQEEGVWKEGRKAVSGEALAGTPVRPLCNPSSPPHPTPRCQLLFISREIKPEISKVGQGKGQNQAGYADAWRPKKVQTEN